MKTNMKTLALVALLVCVAVSLAVSSRLALERIKQLETMVHSEAMSTDWKLNGRKIEFGVRADGVVVWRQASPKFGEFPLVPNATSSRTK